MAIKDNSTGQYSLFEIGGELRPYFNRGVSQPLWNERGRADNERHDAGSQGIWLYQGRRRGHGYHRPGCGYYASHRDETYGTSHEAAQEAARRNKKDGAAWDKRDKASVKVIWDNLIGVSVFCEDQTEESRFDPFGGK